MTGVGSMEKINQDARCVAHSTSSFIARYDYTGDVEYVLLCVIPSDTLIDFNLCSELELPHRTQRKSYTRSES